MSDSSKAVTSEVDWTNDRAVCMAAVDGLSLGSDGWVYEAGDERGFAIRECGWEKMRKLDKRVRAYESQHRPSAPQDESLRPISQGVVMPDRSLEEMLRELEAKANAADMNEWHLGYPSSVNHNIYAADKLIGTIMFRRCRGLGQPFPEDYPNAEYVVFSQPAFAIELIAAVRSALSPERGELPQRPKPHHSNRQGVQPRLDYYCETEVVPYFSKLESLLRAAYAEVERLKREVDEMATELKREHDRAESAKQALSTCRADERERCLEAVKVLRFPRHEDLIQPFALENGAPPAYVTRSWAIRDAEQTILTLGEGK